MTEKLKLPNMYMTPMGAVYNHLESGAIQIIHGVRMEHLAGLYERAQDDTFVVNIPVNDKGDFVTHEINSEMALHIDWILVNAHIVECWRDEKISTKSLRGLDIQQILLRSEIIDVVKGVGIVKDEYIYHSPQHMTEKIDNSHIAVPIHAVKKKKNDK